MTLLANAKDKIERGKSDTLTLCKTNCDECDKCYGGQTNRNKGLGKEYK